MLDTIPKEQHDDPDDAAFLISRAADARRMIMAEREQQALLAREIQARFERKLREAEIGVLEYWKEQVDQVAAMKPEGIAAMQMRVRNISERMANRIRTLKRES